MVTDTTLAYLAGILDGEGCFNIYRGGKRPRIDYTGRLYVVSTDRVLIDWLQEHFGGFTYTREVRIEWKTKYEWILERSKSVEVCRAILPYLVIKKPQAELLILFQQSFTEMKVGGRLTDDQRALRERCFFRMKELNHRGHSVVKEPS